MEKATCDLCGLPLKHGSVVCKEFDTPLYFCCNGCRQVYIMLMAAGNDPNPQTFQDTEIYKRCVAAGIIPKSTQDLENRSKEKILGQRQNDTQSNATDPEPNVTAPEPGLPLDLQVQGMWCPACAWVIEETLLKQSGVLNATCRFTTDQVKLNYNPVHTSPNQLIDIINKLGYHSMPADADPKSSTYRKEFIRLVISAFITMNVMMLSFALYTGFFTQITADTIEKLTWPLVIMSCIVFFYGGAPIHQRAVSGLLKASAGMEALISIGASSAFFYSLFNWWTGSIHLYFDTTCMLITLVLIGKTIEQRTKDRIKKQIGSFMDMQPSKVRICTADFPLGKYMHIGQLSHGDVFRVAASETIPADGRILDGQARIDESTLSGEARPIRKKPGDRVSSGTRVVSGTINVTARAIGKNSLVGQLATIMEAALDHKTQMEDITDKALKYFVPAIILLAFMTAFVCLAFELPIQTAFIRAVTVLVISCPCALGVAIPLARVASISLAGKHGILVHHFTAFDRIHKVDTFIFDKTGTLTRGQWHLLDMQTYDPWDPDSVLSLAAGLELHASHYIGAALVQTAQNRYLKPATATQVIEQDNGISGYIDGAFVKIGSADFLGVELKKTDGIETDAPNNPTEPVSFVHMSVDDKSCACFLFGDSIRESSPEIISHMQQQGLKLALISGDSQTTTDAVGHKLGLFDCHGDMLPEEKANFIKARRKQGACVAMVGDGINDVPALASADLGIAVHSAYRIGTEASAITLMGNDPAQIKTFKTLASKVNRTIRQNLVFTFFYNIVSIPIAMSGLLNPLVAVCAMLMSSLSVTGNTLILARKISRKRDEIT
jgi:heavy metal translocating P-type ATPase